MTGEEQLKQEGEELIIRSQGYLKPPESWRKKYDLRNSEQPIAFSQTQDGKKRLIFEWDEEDLKEAEDG